MLLLPPGAVLPRVVLASASPRRAGLLRSLGLNLDIIPSTFAEDLDKSLFTPAEYVVENARIKALEVAQQLQADTNQSSAMVVGADTVVVLDEDILEKPADERHAREMLQRLSGRTHRVLTGVAIARVIAGKEEIAMDMFHEETRVLFADLPVSVIDAYVASGEPMDKAGGYGIQGLGKCLVETLDGCYFNVVGFPVHRFWAHVLTYYT